MHAPILQFLGAAGTVTGSRFLIETEQARVLVDCGMFQGRREDRRRNWADFPVDPASIDAVLLTHAHLDHCGYLPRLVALGYAGAAHCSPYTRELAPIVLRDSARLHEEEAAFANRAGYSKHHPALPLYTSEDAAAAIGALTSTPFEEPTVVAPGVQATFRPAGHILGSATIELRVQDGDGARTLLFTGDLGRPQHPMLAPPAPPPAADVIVSESTYGDRVHEDEEEGLERLADAVRRTAERGGMVIIPAFAVDRTEVMLLALARLVREERVPRLPIYADSPMALKVLEVYRRALAERAPELRDDLALEPFEEAGELHEAHTPDESRALNDLRHPSIIISASGMATGGRVLHHLERRLPDHRNTVILPGFQAPGTRGASLADGAREVKMLGHYVPVRADVVHLNAFSVHADADELVGWLGSAPTAPDAAFIVHGEPTASEALQQRLVADLGWHAIVPRYLERIRIV